ncbi:GntR family transcriptional regulator [Allonocardiopsis opalescens]|uniref:DNA-binding transcriptional regulator YhcF (GntR family) n=1 Tax=Allonocardiopsis opalescens TaxID=1144618 RepID=A0A2T0QFN6_9ACTN|nr:GntR family transcriptional regulator [Allonocardiopsis opalescens]PRY02746.1 DNA-binding transcriptional regulator YhcF (GntR family) [Allonocardiopsis opalescens]
MILNLDLDSEVPIYQQLRDQIVTGIARGELAAGSPLPSTRQLGVDLGINFHTVNKSYDLLKREGLLRVNRKSGAVVQRDAASGPPDGGFLPGWRQRLEILLAEAAAHGVPPDEVLEHCSALLASFDASRPAPAAPSPADAREDTDT